MKRLYFILLLFPLISLSQKIKINEYDKFIRQRRIELEPLSIASSDKASLSMTFNSLGQGLYVLLSGSGWGASTVDADQEVIFLFSNDSTVAGRSTGLQTYEASLTRNSFKHKYAIGLPDLQALSKYELIGIRKYSFNDHSDIKVSKDCATKVKKFSALFMEELKKSKVVLTLQHINLSDIAKHTGDSVTFCTRVHSSRYFEASENKPTVLDINNNFGSQPVNIVIWEQDRKNFSNAPESLYNNRDVCITGVVRLYNNIPQIVISKREQIVLRTPIGLDEVAKFIGDSVTVQGKVHSGKYLMTSQNSPTLLNMGAAYPDQVLTLVIENKDRPNFKEEPENYYPSREISITGRITLYKDKPQIIVRTKDQIIEKAGPAVPESITTVQMKPDSSVITQQAQKNEKNKIDVKAMFPGGPHALSGFLQDNLVCPEELTNGEKKQVIARFLVKPDGSASDFKIVQSAGNTYDDEVLRVLKRMPKWAPQVRNGTPVSESITQPITFSR